MTTTNLLPITTESVVAQLAQFIEAEPKKIAERDYWRTQCRIWEEQAAIHAEWRERVDNENAMLRKWIEELDVLAENDGDHREWLGSEIGWLYPGCAAYYASPRREDILSNTTMSGIAGDAIPTQK